MLSSRRAGSTATRTLRAAVVVGVALCSVVACSSSKSGGSSGSSGASGSASSGSSGPTGGSYNVQVIADLTGPSAQIQGIGITGGIKTVIDTLNDAGGINGKYKIKLTVNDAASDANQALSAARTAIAAKPNFIVAGVTSTEVAAVLPIITSAGIPAMYAAISQTSILPTQKLVFTQGTIPSQPIRAYIAEAKALLGNLSGKKVALEGLQTPSVDQINAGLRSLLTAAGATISGEYRTTGSITSFNSQAAAIKSSGADMVMGSDSASNTNAAAQALATVGFTGPYLGAVSAASDPFLTTLANPNYYGLRGGTATADMIAAATKDGAQGNASYFVDGWEIGYIMQQAFTKCPGACSYDQMVTSLEGINNYTVPGDSLYGPISYSSTRHYALTKMQFFAWDPATKKVVAKGDPVDVTDGSAVS